MKIAVNGGGMSTVLGGLNAPQGVAVDAFGDVYIANTGAGSVLEVLADGVAQMTLATGLTDPTGIAVDGSGNLYVVEASNGTVVELPVTGGLPIQPVSLTSGLNQANSIAVDAAGNLYVSEPASELVVRIDAATHDVTTVVGSGTAAFTGNGGPATQATLNAPMGVAADGTGTLYIADSSNQVVRKVTVGPSSATLAFMTTALGTTSSDSPQSAMVTNIGNQPLNISALSTTANFGLASTTTCSTASTLALGTSCIVGLNFTPAAVGNLLGTATLADNALNATAPQATQTIPLSGSGVYQATELVFAPPPTSSILANSSIGTVTVDVDTAAGGIATTSNVPVTLTLTGPSGFTAQTYTVNSVNGVATFTLTTPLTMAGHYMLTATSSGLPSATAAVTVAVVMPVLTWNPAVLSVPYGTVLGAGVLDANVNGGVQGSFAYAAQSAGGAALAVNPTTVLSSGTYTLTATFTPTDQDTYAIATRSVTFAVTNVTLVVVANSATRVYGTANPPFAGTVLGAVHGDMFVETFTTTAQLTSNAGTYPIVPVVAGPNLADYTVMVNDGILTITKANSRLMLQASGSSGALGSTVALGSAVTLTATASTTTTGAPTGIVTFYSGSDVLGTATLNAQGVATLTVSSLPVGTDVISGMYGGDGNFIGANAQLAQPVKVGVSNFSISAAPTSLVTKQGKGAGTLLTLTPQYGYTETIHLSCVGLPAGASCQFGPAAIVMNGNNQSMTSQLTIETWGAPSTVVAANKTAHRTGIVMASIFWLPGLLFAGLLGVGRRKLRGNPIRALVVPIVITTVLGMLGGLTGCADLTPTTSPGAYSITVIATPATGTSHSVTLQLAVQD